jgi:hypothetical protein
MLRKALAVAAGILLLALLVVASQFVASESGEVVVLKTRDAAGELRETRLWVVDHDGALWLRAGNPEGGWFPRLVAYPNILLVRGGQALILQATPMPQERDTINRLMHEKYGWADSYVCLFFPREKKIPVRLAPLEPTS